MNMLLWGVLGALALFILLLGVVFFSQVKRRKQVTMAVPAVTPVRTSTFGSAIGKASARVLAGGIAAMMAVGAVIAGSLVLQQLYYMNRYGDRASEVRTTIQERNVAKALASPEVMSRHRTQEAVAPSVETSVTALTISGACSEPIVVPKGWDIRSTITSGIRQEKKDTAGSEWTPMVDRASLYATRYCGEGQVLYQFISTS